MNVTNEINVIKETRMKITFLVISADFLGVKYIARPRSFHGTYPPILTIYFNYRKHFIFQFLQKTVVWKSLNEISDLKKKTNSTLNILMKTW